MIKLLVIVVLVLTGCVTPPEANPLKVDWVEVTRPDGAKCWAFHKKLGAYGLSASGVSCEP